MNTYKQESLLELMQPVVINALKNIYGISLKHLVTRLNMTPQAVFYLLKNNRLKDYQKEIILALFQDHGLETAELIVIHTMLQKRKKK